MAFSKVLIANRGEIALRVIRACREAGLRTVAVYSQADAEALHVRFADEAVCIGPPPSAASYLNIPALISAAEITGADAVHPGYGFLAENAEFAEICTRCGLVFIGPSAELMRLMGDKVRARQTMADAGVPVLPGTGVLDTEKQLRDAAAEIGYPLIIKASAGGGGRGMKIVHDESQLVPSWVTARTEAQAGFSNPDVYVERFVAGPRHIEVQIIGDHHGQVLHLGERECSIQRRHQKLIEESPSVVLTPDQRRELGALAVEACRRVGYQNAGTLEFLMDEQGRCYFMEMNTRLQVEHTVTELVTGIDMVRMQLDVAAGKPLGLEQKDVQIRGHAIECRVNAEDAQTFAPSPGRITTAHFPGGLGVRIDTAIYAQYVVPPHYDSLVAKIVVWGENRRHAIERMDRALGETVIEGISTNIKLFQRLMRAPDFIDGRFDTHFLERWRGGVGAGP